MDRAQCLVTTDEVEDGSGTKKRYRSAVGCVTFTQKKINHFFARDGYAGSLLMDLGVSPCRH